jgi:hypothetical protein
MGASPDRSANEGDEMSRAYLERAPDAAYTPSVEEWRSLRLATIVAIAAGFAAFMGQVISVGLLVLILAKVGDLGPIALDNTPVKAIVCLA